MTKAQAEPKELKCSDKVEARFESEMQDLRAIMRAENSGRENKELGSLNEHGICFDYVAPNTFSDQPQGYARYQICWGGPSEEFRFYLNPDLTPYLVEFWFMDWNDGSEHTLTGKDHDLLLEIYEWFGGSSIVENAMKDA